MRDVLGIWANEFAFVGGSATFLLKEIFPDTSTTLLEKWEKSYNLSSDGNTTMRRARIIAAMRKQGGLSLTYLERLANTLGLSIGTFRYRFDTGIVAPANERSFRLDSATHSAATNIFIDTNTLDKELIDGDLLGVTSGELLYIFDAYDGARYLKYATTGAPTQSGNTITIPITFLSSAGAAFITSDELTTLVIGSALGFQSKITEGSGPIGFITHDFGPNTIPKGPGTPLPATVYEDAALGNTYCIELVSYGLTGGTPSANELERIINQQKGAWAKATFTYIP